MTFKYPVIGYRVSLSEYPNHISCVIELGNCTQNCPNCHRPDMKENGQNQTLQEIKEKTDTIMSQGANGIVIMGGTTNNIPLEKLKALINLLGSEHDVCLYSGLDGNHDDIFYNTLLDALKIGSYQPQYGGLTNPTTNQRFYIAKYILIYKEGGNECRKVMKDITPTFYAQPRTNSR